MYFHINYVSKSRFKSPKLYIEADDTILDVSKESKVICPQIHNNTVFGQEDCLLLNIYVPNGVYNNPTTKVPVMVYIHGGGLVSIYLIFILLWPEKIRNLL